MFIWSGQSNYIGQTGCSVLAHVLIMQNLFACGFWKDRTIKIERKEREKTSKKNLLIKWGKMGRIGSGICRSSLLLLTVIWDTKENHRKLQCIPISNNWVLGILLTDVYELSLWINPESNPSHDTILLLSQVFMETCNKVLFVNFFILCIYIIEFCYPFNV